MFTILVGIAFIIIGALYLVPLEQPIPKIGGACLLIAGILILLGH